MEKYLIVVDMQKDFVNGALGTREAEDIVANVAEKVKNFPGTVIFTKDTHFADYLSTQEGKKLPVEHCIKGTSGWELTEALQELCEQKNAQVYEKTTFGCTQLAKDLQEKHGDGAGVSLELVGLCTDICVVSNALLLKAFMTEAEISVDASCTAGVTPMKHDAALETMRSCQIQILENRPEMP